MIYLITGINISTFMLNMEQNTEPTDKFLHIWPNDFLQGYQGCREGQLLQQMVLRKFDIHMQTGEVGSLLIAHTKIKYLNRISKTIKLLEENIGGNYRTLDLAEVSWL